MRRAYSSVLAIAAVVVLPNFVAAQAATEAPKAVVGGGITAKGWEGKVDATETSKYNLTLKDAKFAQSAKGDTLHVVTGPATGYWNSTAKATGNYTVSAKFNEPAFMGLNDHAHPYGIVIAANDTKGDSTSYLYCATYGNGSYIVRGFGPMPFALGGRRPVVDAAVHSVAKGEPVTQEIAMTVSADKVDCTINGKTVASFPKDSVVGPGKLKSTDGYYGVRFAHNTEGFVTGFKMTPVKK